MYCLKCGEKPKAATRGAKLNGIVGYGNTNLHWDCSSLNGLLSKDEGLVYALRPKNGWRPNS